MIKVFISINNNEEVIQLPVPPEEWGVTSPWNNEELSGLRSTIRTIGLRGLRTIEINSFFPAVGHDYPFLQSRAMWGMDYVNTIERWRYRRIPIRIVIVDTDGKKNVNLPVTIDEFEYRQRKDGDIYFTLRLTEFVFVDVRR